jgi:glycerophosphoryl diester phosphodiesterase
MAIFLEKKFHIQGHRGCRGVLPENTIESCCEAVLLGVDGLEIDVVCSSDGQIVVSHEPWMSSHICSFPNSKPILQSNLYKMPYDLIRQFDCGLKGNARFPLQKPQKAYKPTLTELVTAVYDFCKKNHKPIPFFNIEIKSHPQWYGKYIPMPTDFIKLLEGPLSILSPDTYYISSFDPYFLKNFHKKNPKTTVGLLTEKKQSVKNQLSQLGFKPNIFSPYYRHLDNQTIRLCKNKGIDIIVWTVNDIKAVQKLEQQGIKGIITDYPNLFSVKK